MNHQELRTKILEILCKSGSVEDMVFDKETIAQITEVVNAIKIKNVLTKSEILTLSKNGQWSFEKANTMRYDNIPQRHSEYTTATKPMRTPEENAAIEAKAPKISYSAMKDPVRTPGADEVKATPKTVKPTKDAPAAKPKEIALDTVKNRQTAHVTEPPAATPKKFR